MPHADPSPLLSRLQPPNSSGTEERSIPGPLGDGSCGHGGAVGAGSEGGGDQIWSSVPLRAHVRRRPTARRRKEDEGRRRGWSWLQGRRKPDLHLSELAREDCYSIEEYKKTYDHFLMLVEGKESWPDSGHPKLEPPARVRMPGKLREKRTREAFEPAKPTKHSGVGTRIECGLCNRYDHNSRKCPLNPEVGQKKMAYIRRAADKKRKRQDAENTVEKGALLGTQQSSIITDPVGTSEPVGINKPARSKPLGNKTGARKVATGKKSGG